MIVETSNLAHVANPAAAQLPRSPKTQAFEGVVMYYGYRFYDPETGRWPSRDPIGERGGINLYGFVGNDGMNVVDAFGHQSVVPPVVQEDPNPAFYGVEPPQEVSNTSEVEVETKCCKCRFTVTHKFAVINGRIFTPSISYEKGVIIGGSQCTAEIGQPVAPNGDYKPKMKFGGENPLDRDRWDWLSQPLPGVGGSWIIGELGNEVNRMRQGDYFTRPGYAQKNEVEIDFKERVFCNDLNSGEEVEGELHTKFSWP